MRGRFPFRPDPRCSRIGPPLEEGPRFVNRYGAPARHRSTDGGGPAARRQTLISYAHWVAARGPPGAGPCEERKQGAHHNHSQPNAEREERKQGAHHNHSQPNAEARGAQAGRAPQSLPAGCRARGAQAGRVPCYPNVAVARLRRPSCVIICQRGSCHDARPALAFESGSFLLRIGRSVLCKASASQQS